MQPDPTFTITCDELLEFEEDAAPFAKGEPEFVNGAGPATAPAPSSPPPLPAEQPTKESA